MASDRELAAQLSGTERDHALTELVRRHGRMIERTALRLTNNADLAQDVAQAVLLILLNRSAGLTREGSLAGWLHQTTVLAARNVLKAEARRKRREQKAATEMYAQPTQQRDLPAHLDVALQRLPDIYREAIVLRFFENRDRTEMAAALGLSEMVIDKRVSRGLERLRKSLSGATAGLTLAALMQALTVEGAQAATLGPAALSLPAAAASAPHLAPVVKGAVKAMFWLKVKSVATAVGATLLVGAVGTQAVRVALDGPSAAKKTVSVGPLVGLPSAPGPQLAKIKALGDNQWLQLDSPSPDPQWGPALSRAWGAKMVYAFDLGGAFIAGQAGQGGVRNGRYNNIFFYDANANRWICVFPGIDTTTFAGDFASGRLLVNEDGQVVDNEGQAQFSLGGFIYQNHAYDWNSGIYYIANNADGTCSDQYNRTSSWYQPAAEFINEQMLGKQDRATGMPYAVDTRSGRITRPGAIGAHPGAGDAGGVVYYLPTKKVLWFFQQRTQGVFFDPATRQCTDTNAAGPSPTGIDFGACYDSKRDRIYVAGGNYRDAWKPGEGYVYVYDVATNAWSNQPNRGTFPDHFDNHSSIMHYDSVNDRVVLVMHGNEREKQGIYVYDPDSGIWDSEKLPLPEEQLVPSCWSAFYSPALNVHFVYEGADGGVGTMWAYRYRNPR